MIQACTGDTAERCPLFQLVGLPLGQREKYVRSTSGNFNKRSTLPLRSQGVVARLAQLVERQPFKLVVVGSSPTVGSLI